MVMTQTQWNRLQMSLPPEDRMSWEEYLASSGTAGTGDTGGTGGTGDTSGSGTKTAASADTGTDLGFINTSGLTEDDFIKSMKKAEEDAAAAKAKAEADAKAKADAEAKARADAEAKARADAELKARIAALNAQNNRNVYNASTQASTTQVSSIPNTPPISVPTSTSPPIKTAPIDTILFDNDAVDTALITDLLFENVGGQEILSIARYDTVNGQDVSYQAIKNLNIIQDEYNPNNILKLQKTSTQIFANYPINLSTKIPYVGNGVNGENVYLDGNGNLVIELVDLNSDEQVEVQITTSGTIYEVGI